MNSLPLDIRHAFRSLAKSPAFTAVAIASLAIGIGFNTAIFSIVHSVLWAPLPYGDASRLVRIGHVRPDSTQPGASFSPQDFEDLERERAGFASVASYDYQRGLTGMNLTGGGEPARPSVAFVSGGFFQTLGTQAAAGRFLQPGLDVPGKDGVIVLGHGFWQRHFGADPGAIGRTVRLDGRPFTVVGVMPAAFAFPSAEVDLWAPVSLLGEDMVPHRREVRWLSVIGRLKPGTSLPAAAGALDTLLARLEKTYPESNEGFGKGRVQPLADTVLGEVRGPLLLLLASVGLVLLITCANLASLLLARASSRVREVAIRTALGAPRGRIVRQFLTESILLSFAGGAAGLFIATWSVETLTAAAGAYLPRVGEVRIDGIVFGFTGFLSVVTGLFFGLVPALHASRPGLVASIEGSGRSGSADRGRRRILRGLVVAEAAVAVVLLVGAGLLARSFWNLLHVSPGMRVENVLTLSITIPTDRYDTDAKEFAYRRELLRRMAALPGVSAAGASKTMPLKGGGEAYSFFLEGHTERQARIQPEAGAFIVTPGYFSALGIPVVSGRDFSQADIDTSRPVLLVNQALARRLWPGESPLGKGTLFGRSRLEVIGVVGDVRQNGLGRAPGGAIYVPISRFPRATLKIFLRSAQEPATLAGMARAAIRDLDPEQPISEIATLTQVVADTVARPRLLTLLLLVFGAVALALAALGVYGVLSFAVSQRTREIGIRMALGARTQDILRLVVGEGAILSALGAALALPAALAAGRLVQSLLYEVRPADPTVLAAASVFLVLVGVVAASLPARRAAGISPMEALRNE
jgi:putative ABC transport system permease protein